jgi:hypothetical protein
LSPRLREQLRQLRERSALGRRDDLLDRNAEVERPRARAEEAGAVGGVLDGVGERQELLVVVEARREELIDEHAGERGRSEADEREALACAAERTVALELVLAGDRVNVVALHDLDRVPVHLAPHPRQRGGRRRSFWNATGCRRARGALAGQRNRTCGSSAKKAR